MVARELMIWAHSLSFPFPYGERADSFPPETNDSSFFARPVRTVLGGLFFTVHNILHSSLDWCAEKLMDLCPGGWGGCYHRIYGAKGTSCRSAFQDPMQEQLVAGRSEESWIIFCYSYCRAIKPARPDLYPTYLGGNHSFPIEIRIGGGGLYGVITSE